jgi:3-oxoacyl-[acyl-carrier-protein] synthase III
MNNLEDSIGINALGSYIPEKTLNVEEIARMSGISAQILFEKIGMQEKHIADENETPSFMGTKATQVALEKSGVLAEEIDVIIYAAAGLFDYTVWSPAAKIQSIIGAKNATCFEVRNGCGAGNLALHLCKSWLLTNKKNHGLVVCAEGLSKLVNYQDPDSISLYMIGDGAAATVLSRNEPTNQMLGFASFTDGTLSDYVKIPGGGTVNFPADPGYKKDLSYFSISDPIELSHIFDHIYLKNYKRVITESVTNSGYTTDAINFLLTNQLKQTTSDAILSAFNLTREKTITSLTHYGHMGAVDSLYCLDTLLSQNKIKKDDLVVIASSATGFTWAANTIKF